jgi:glycolate oxidase
VVLSLERLDRIVAVDEGNMTATVEPGVITQVLQEEVEARGLFYPPDPASRGSCTIGGNIAENAGGPRAVKYGVTGEYVMALEAVLVDGSVIRTGGACRKDVAGYDLTRLLVGSEGTLALVTLATLRLIPLPAERRLFLAGFPTLEAGIQGVLEVLRRLTPSTCEYLERAAVEAAAGHLGMPLPMAGAGSYLLVEVDGGSEADVDAQLEAAGGAVEDAGATEVRVAMTPREEDELWRLRRAAGEAVKAISPYRELDCVVPRPRIAELVAGVKRIAGRYGVDTICYGHAGDGNIHVNVLRREATVEHWRGVLRPLATEIFELAVSLGGTITGEHGVGWINREAMRLRHGPAELEVMRALKAVFDPRGLLNPDKVLP